MSWHQAVAHFLFHDVTGVLLQRRIPTGGSGRPLAQRHRTARHIPGDFQRIWGGLWRDLLAILNKGDLTDLNTRGEAMSAMLGACKYDAVIPGNHDYSFGTSRLAELTDAYSLPVVAANCRWPDEFKPQQAVPFRIFKLEGVTVGIIGTATPISNNRKDELLEILPIAQSLDAVVAELDRQVDVIALLTHIGLEADRKLARALPRVDVIFGGHNHKRFAELDFDAETQTVIQHSGALVACIGELTLTWDGEKIVDRKVRLLSVTAEMPSSAAVQSVRAKYTYA